MEDDYIVSWVKLYQKSLDLKDCLFFSNQIHVAISADLRKFILGKVPFADFEDVLHETLKAIFKSLDAFRGQKNGQFFKWCYRIARNKISDFYRKKERDERLTLFPIEEIEKMLDEVSDQMPSPQTRMELQDAMNLLGKTKPACGEILSDHYWSGLKANEIAAQLGLKIPTVRRRIERCLDALRKLLSE